MPVNSQKNNKETIHQNSPDSGNASNPTPRDTGFENDNQLLNKEADKYIREVANIEDLPDGTDQEELDDTLDKDGEKN